MRGKVESGEECYRSILTPNSSLASHRVRTANHDRLAPIVSRFFSLLLEPTLEAATCSDRDGILLMDVEEQCRTLISEAQ